MFFQNKRRMRKILYITLFAGLFFASCVSEDIPGDGLENGNDDQNIEIIFSVPSFQLNTTSSRSTRATDSPYAVSSTRATDAGSTEEQQVANLYLFLFDSSGTNPLKYAISSPGDFSVGSGGTWNSTENRVSLNLTRSEARMRDVYIVANYPVGSPMATALGNVTTLAQLQAVVHNETIPWSPSINTPIMMSGSVEGHDFIASRQLNSVSLTRAVAKLELNISLKPERQSIPVVEEGFAGNTTPVHQYLYQFVDFDKNTYAFKPATKPDDVTGSADWVAWEASGTLTAYTTDGDGKVTGLTLTTYLNERDNPGTAVKLRLPYNSGLLPPPEFGDEDYTLRLPATVVRNTWYRYDIEI